MVERQAQAVRAQQSAVTLLLTILFALNPKQFAQYFSLDLLPCLPLSLPSGWTTILTSSPSTLLRPTSIPLPATALHTIALHHGIAILPQTRSELCSPRPIARRASTESAVQPAPGYCWQARSSTSKLKQQHQKDCCPSCWISRC